MNYTIKFRPFTLSDAAFINRLRRDESMENLIGGAKRPVAYERDVKWIESIILNDNQHVIYFAITTIEDDNIIGYTSIADIDYRNGSCFWNGIKIDPSHAGKGIGTQVALMVLKYVFEELRMERCKGECQEQHENVLKMLLKVGFKQEGLMRNTLYKNGIYNNQWLVSVIKEDYDSNKEPIPALINYEWLRYWFYIPIYEQILGQYGYFQ